MKLIWISYIFEILILTLLKPLITNFETVALIAVLIHVIFSMLVLLRYKSKFRAVLLGAFLARVGLMIWDIYARSIFILPNSGLDSEMFYGNAVSISNDMSLLVTMEGLRGGIYSQITGLLFYLIGPQRAFGQYLNVLLGLSIIYVVYNILKLLNTDKAIILSIISIAAFFPTSMIMSAIFLREIFPTFFISISIYYFTKWFKQGKLSNIFLALFTLGFAGMFHSGVLGIALGYSFAFLFYKRNTKSLQFSTSTIFMFVLIVLSFSLSFNILENQLLGKFQDVESINDIYFKANYSRGGSAYLSNITINNPIQLVIYGPLKSFFFLTAPLPMNWRGTTDVVSFFTDSLLYLGVIIYFLKNRKNFKNNTPMILSFFIMIIGAAIIFGIGVGNAGTAMRHRQKIVPLFLILLGVMRNATKKHRSTIK